MSFDHERLDVYQRALELLDLCDSIIEQLPHRASVVLNVAEGAGEFSPDEKCRFYRIARRSATEAGAILHIYARRRQGPQDTIATARELLVRVVSMLVQMIKTVSRR
jgi:four helix bundle protein